MTKKLLLILGIIIIIALATFWVLNRSTNTENTDGTVGFSIRDFLPFGSNDNTIQTDMLSGKPDTTSNILDTNTSVDTVVPKLRKLSREPVAGAIVFNQGTSTIVRFVEKGTGNVYEANGSTARIVRLTNNTIPKVVRAIWLPDGSGFLAQTIDSYTEAVETSFVKIVNPKSINSSENITPFSIVISKLPIGINEIIARPDSKKIVYYVPTQTGSSWYISNPDGTESSRIIDLPTSEWIPRAYSGNTVVIQTKSSYISEGNTYEINIESKSITKTGTGFVGLAANPDYDLKPYLVSKGGRIPTLTIVNEVSGAYVNIDINSLAEKCVWSKNKQISILCAVPNSIPSANYPDDWYKGKINTTDTVKKIDYINRIQTNISDLGADSNERIDVINPQISNNDTHLIFRNKIDGFLWILSMQ